MHNIVTYVTFVIRFCVPEWLLAFIHQKTAVDTPGASACTFSIAFFEYIDIVVFVSS